MSDPPAPPAPDASDLCTACGLCCDGSLFGKATAYPEEVDRILRHGLTLREDSDDLAFRQPCPCLAGATCTIYAERFVTCRGFRCKLLKKLDRGEIDLAEGRARIVSARTLLAAAEHGAQSHDGRMALLPEVDAWTTVADPAARTAMARRHLALIALERFLNTHFRNEPRAAAKEAVEDSTA